MKHLMLDFHGWTAEDFRYQSTREDWAEELGICVKTIQRYELEILYRDISLLPTDGGDRLTQAFYWRNRRERYKLDYYQKFILWIIKMLSFGEAYANEKLSYEEIQDWFSEIDSNTGKKRILSITPPIVKQWLS